jgi:hypothetical protein
MEPESAIDKARQDLEARLLELRPYVEEEARIRRLLAAMDDVELDESGSYDRPRVSGAARRLQILALLNDRGGPMRVKDLAEALLISSGRVSQLTATLVEQGLVNRTSSGIEITSTGKEELPPSVEIAVGRPQIVEASDD